MIHVGLRLYDVIFRGLAAAALVVLTIATLAAGPPAGARRESPPPKIDSSAVAVDAPAPTFVLPSADGGRFALVDAIAKGPTAVVFYRGYW